MRKKAFKQARKCMMESDYSGNARVGCVLYYKGHLLASGHNSDKTSPVQKQYNTRRYKESKVHYLPDKLHAEIHALSKIRMLDIDFSKVEIYIYRELKNGEQAMARPCPSCHAFIRSFGIKNIYYTTEHGYAHEKINY